MSVGANFVRRNPRRAIIHSAVHSSRTSIFTGRNKMRSTFPHARAARVLRTVWPVGCYCNLCGCGRVPTFPGVGGGGENSIFFKGLCEAYFIWKVLNCTCIIRSGPRIGMTATFIFALAGLTVAQLEASFRKTLSCMVKCYWRWSRIYTFVFFTPAALRPYSGPWSSLTGFRDHTQTHHTRWDSSARVISPTYRSLPDSTQYLHDLCEIRTHNPSKWAAAEPHLRTRGR